MPQVYVTRDEMSMSGQDRARALKSSCVLRLLGADDRARTGDINLGKVALYQLSYVRLLMHFPCGRHAE